MIVANDAPKKGGDKKHFMLGFWILVQCTCINERRSGRKEGIVRCAPNHGRNESIKINDETANTGICNKCKMV